MSDDSHERKKNTEEEHDNHERWLVSYADFITLLFAFFVVMYATSSNNQEKQKSFQESVRTNLKLMVPGAGPGEGNSGANEGNVGGEAAGETLIQLDGFPPRGAPGETEQYIERALEKSMDSGDKEKVQELRHDAIGVRIALASSQFFLPGGVKIRTSALKALDKIAAILKETDKKIVIEGHTDNTPVGENAGYDTNWELASLRATSIVKYLVKYHKIDPARLSAISYADTRPLESNDSAAGRARNRRIEIYIILDEKLQN